MQLKALALFRKVSLKHTTKPPGLTVEYLYVSPITGIYVFGTFIKTENGYSYVQR